VLQSLEVEHHVSIYPSESRSSHGRGARRWRSRSQASSRSRQADGARHRSEQEPLLARGLLSLAFHTSLGRPFRSRLRRVRRFSRESGMRYQSRWSTTLRSLMTLGRRGAAASEHDWGRRPAAVNPLVIALRVTTRVADGRDPPRLRHLGSGGVQRGVERPDQSLRDGLLELEQREGGRSFRAVDSVTQRIARRSSSLHAQGRGGSSSRPRDTTCSTRSPAVMSSNVKITWRG
jgi:hypothetical protein